MKFLRARYSLFFIFASNAYASVPSMSMDFVHNISSDKKIHNAIRSSVKHNTSGVTNNVFTSQESISPEHHHTILGHLASSAPQQIQATEQEVDGQNFKRGNEQDLAPDKEDMTIDSVAHNDNGLEENNVMKEVANSEQDHAVEEETEEVDSEEFSKKALLTHEAILIAKKEQEDELASKEINVVYQNPGFVDDQESVIFNFEETDLSNVASYMEAVHNVKFLTEDILSPAKDAKGLSGHKITFSTNKVLTKKESWDLFLAFLHMGGLDLVPMTKTGFYKIVPFTKVSGQFVPTYIGVDPAALPDNDMVVRYIYFVQNLDPAKIQNLLLKFKAGSATIDVFSELRALIFFDRANNIKSLMQIALAMDKAVLPESLSVIKMKRANVADVKALYESLKSGGSSGTIPNQPAQQKAWNLGKKESSYDYFPQDVKLFTDARTNSLILLGSNRGIEKIEEFVEKYIDIDVKKDAPPIFTYQLEYTNATDIVTILTQAITYGKGTPAGQYGGVRDGIKYFSQMTIIAEPHSNSVIVNSTKDDFEALVPLIKELDTPQKQIGIEVLIVQVTDSQAKTLGSQISGPKGPDAPVAANEQAQTFAQNITSQTSGILGVNGQSTAPVVIPNSSNTSYSLKASLGTLLGTAYNAVVNEPGSVLVTFGQPIWALFKILQSMVSVHVVANPFVVVSNNVPATVSIGEQRRILASQVVSVGGTTTNALTNMQSTLGFTITPQINKGNIINLAINVYNNQFTVAGSQTSALQDQKSIITNASVANGEVLVLGGLMQEQYASTSRGVPFLEHIPIFGWFFKSKVKTVDKSHFLVFISPRIIDSIDKKEDGIDSYSLYKMKEAQKNIDIMDEIDWFASRRDPIQKAFFGESMPRSMQELAGQDATIQSERKQRARHKRRIHEASQNASKKTKSKDAKQDKELSHPDSSGIVSFDQDFRTTSLKSSTKAKNAISTSMRKEGLHNG